MNAAKFVFSLAILALAPMTHAVAQEELGPLSGTVPQQLLKGWKGGSQDGWYVLRNDAEAESEQTLVINAGPPPESGRTTSVNVSLNSKIPEAAIGILARHVTKNDLCLMEITASATANLFCLIDGKRQNIASVANAAKMDGSDIIEMLEIPGMARFFLNGTAIGDVDAASALGGELGIMAYERGTFGIADVSIVEEKAQASGSGLPPKGGSTSSDSGGLPPKGGAGAATSGQGTSSDSVPAGSTDAATRMAGIMGPLADTIMSAPNRDGWQLAFEGNWAVLINDEKASSENYFTVHAGPVGNGERVTRLEVGILPPQGKKASDFSKSAAGIVIESEDGATSCLGEITGAREGLVLCFAADGKATEIGLVPNAAKGDGSDVLEFVERTGRGEFFLNGKSIGVVEGHPSLGADIGILAYERGEFYFGGFSISSGGASGASSAAASASGASTSSDEGPLPMFGGEESRIIGVYLGITNGIFMHEFGHALIGELQVPSTGPEEDAVDIFSALKVVDPTMYPSGDPKIDAIGRQVAIYSALPWYYGGLINEARGSSTPWQDEHTGDLKRFRNVFCVIYGGNPELYSSIAAEVDMDERTLGRCEEEFTRQSRAWRTILAPYTRVDAWHPEGLLPANAPGAGIEVVFEPSQSRIGRFITEAFSEGITGFADDLAKTYALPRGLKVIYKDCGELNAWYSPREGTITMCYDLIEDLAIMISDVEMGTKGGIETSAAASTSSNASSSTTANADASAARASIAAIGARANLADEEVDFGIPGTNVLFPSPYAGPTPRTHPRAKVLTTADLAKMFGDSTPMLLIDTSGKMDTIPGAYTVVDAGKDGSVTDSFQKIVDSWLTEETTNDKSLPVVFFGKSLQDRSAYNAALRAGLLGWNAQWYRGGAEAWQANGLPLVPQD